MVEAFHQLLDRILHGEQALYLLDNKTNMRKRVRVGRKMKPFTSRSEVISETNLGEREIWTFTH